VFGWRSARPALPLLFKCIFPLLTFPELDCSIKPWPPDAAFRKPDIVSTKMRNQSLPGSSASRWMPANRAIGNFNMAPHGVPA
jgi:hypothetical protein